MSFQQPAGKAKEGAKLVVLRRAYDGKVGLELGELVKGVGMKVTRLINGWPAEESKLVHPVTPLMLLVFPF